MGCSDDSLAMYPYRDGEKRRVGGLSYACEPSDMAIKGSRDQSSSSAGLMLPSLKQNSVSGPLFSVCVSVSLHMALWE